jgi:hypothetical protein
MEKFDRYIKIGWYILICILAFYGALHLFVWFWVPVLRRTFC